MTKKEYKTPHLEFVNVDTASILAASGSTGATGEDVPWASAKRRSDFENELWEEENY